MRYVVRKMSIPTKEKVLPSLSSIPCLPCESPKPPPFTNRLKNDLKNDLMYIFSESCYIRFCMHMSSNFVWSLCVTLYTSFWSLWRYCVSLPVSAISSPNLSTSYFSSLIPSHHLKVTKFLVKICQFKFLVMTEKNIFVYKHFLSLNISDF